MYSIEFVFSACFALFFGSFQSKRRFARLKRRNNFSKRPFDKIKRRLVKGSKVLQKLDFPKVGRKCFSPFPEEEKWE